MGTEGDTVRVIAGRYRLRERLGRGGMGVVWRAHDQLLGRQVAVKELVLDESLSPEESREWRDRMLREARAVAQLRHPHVVVVYDVVEHAERLYIVMELIEGGSLAQHVFDHGPLPAAEAARIALALLGALRTAHDSGVLHRDLKPANVLLEPATGRVVLTDFGIAHVNGATTLTETGSFVGSPEYTAPERMSGGRTGPECDLWSLGALLCAILSGVSPFHRDSLGGVLHAVVVDDIRPPEQAAPLLPVVLGLLERDPARRLGAADAERMLRAFLASGRTPAAVGHGGTTVGLGTGPAEGKGQPPRFGRPVLIVAALAAAIAGAGISAAALLVGGGPDSPGSPGSSASSTVSLTPGPSGTGRPSPSASAEPSASGSATAGGTSDPAADPTTDPAADESPASPPAGYLHTLDPEGFALDIPQGYGRSVEGPRIFYVSPDEAIRIGVKETAPEEGGPLAVAARSDAAGPKNNPGYRDGTVTRATRGRYPAARWEFTWDGFSAAEGPRHTFDLCWEEGGRMYDVWVSAPLARLREAERHFDTAVEGFRADPG
ncbi:serine/threonine protein kinase [Streptomyces sp. NA04227]|uniref:serine/threonine-protein kinase n=1 Tax=Streptomyces sp. NA04227 TaxID=2742136 RepID=UPI0015924DA1|nr:serine/threonine-protein kinase [Streptomyces sp. NA04227]QKW08668.1 serine/threonine protein kinase [Streptomyces sp. NA04227]